MEQSGSNNAESSISEQASSTASNLRAWVKVGVIAAASALAGGLAAAWFYRNTLNSLREAESDGSHPASGIPDTETEYEI